MLKSNTGPFKVPKLIMLNITESHYFTAKKNLFLHFSNITEKLHIDYLGVCENVLTVIYKVSQFDETYSLS